MTTTTENTSLSLSALGLDSGRDNGQAAMIRMGVEVAHQYPRDEAQVIAAALKGLDSHPEMATKSLYSIPYQDNRSNRQVRVEGLTVRAAEALGALWGHIRVSVRITGEDKDGFDLEGLVWDMQTNFWLSLPYRTSKWEISRQGQAFVLDERRMLQRLQADVSKVRRNVTLAAIPAHVKGAYEKRVREHLAQGPLQSAATPEKIATIEASFREFKIGEVMVSLADLERYLDGKPSAQWTGHDISELRALYAALVDNQTTVTEAFGTPVPTESRATETTVTPSSINQGTAEGRNAAPPRRGRPPKTVAPPFEGEVAPKPPVAEPVPAPGPLPTPAVLGIPAEEFQGVLTAIHATENEAELNDLSFTYTEAGLFKRASREQKGPLVSALTQKRASFVS